MTKHFTTAACARGCIVCATLLHCLVRCSCQASQQPCMVGTSRQCVPWTRQQLCRPCGELTAAGLKWLKGPS